MMKPYKQYLYQICPHTIVGTQEQKGGPMYFGVAVWSNDDPKRFPWDTRLGLEIATHRSMIQPYSVIEKGTQGKFDTCVRFILGHLTRTKQWNPNLRRVRSVEKSIKKYDFKATWSPTKDDEMSERTHA